MAFYSPGPGSASRLGKQIKLITRYLDTNGDGTGTKNAIADYSGAQEIFYIQPPAGDIYRIAKLLILVSGKKSSFDTDVYGSVPALTNGIGMRIQDDSGTIVDLTDGLTVKRNGQWGRLTHKTELYEGSHGSSNSYFRVECTFAKFGQFMRLVGNNNERLEITVNDDFTDSSSSDALVDHIFCVHGYEEYPAEE